MKQSASFLSLSWQPFQQHYFSRWCRKYECISHKDTKGKITTELENNCVYFLWYLSFSFCILFWIIDLQEKYNFCSLWSTIYIHHMLSPFTHDTFSVGVNAFNIWKDQWASAGMATVTLRNVSPCPCGGWRHQGTATLLIILYTMSALRMWKKQKTEQGGRSMSQAKY